MELLTEIVREVAHEVTTGEFLIELVQGSLLIAILVLVVPRMLKPRLAERQRRIAADLEAAGAAAGEYERAEQEAARIVGAARRDGRRLVREAKAKAVSDRDEIVASAEQEASEIVERARQTVDGEKAAAATQTCEDMVHLVTVVARRFLEESLTESERRALTERIVVSGLESMDTLSVP